MYCVNFLNRSVKIAVSCLALLVMISGAVITGSLFAVRFNRVEKIRIVTGIDSDGEIFKQEEEGESELSDSV